MSWQEGRGDREGERDCVDVPKQKNSLTFLQMKAIFVGNSAYYELSLISAPSDSFVKVPENQQQRKN